MRKKANQNKEETKNFELADGKLELKEYVEIIKFFDKHLMVGAELERVVPIQGTAETSRHFNCENMSYSSSHNFDSTYMKYKNARARNKYNVAFVTSDGTFPYGNEIIYGGNNENFQWNYERLKLIEDKLDQLNAIDFSPQTSTHISVLTGYNLKMKAIILKNIFNMTRAFSGALFWLGSGDKNTILRSNARQYSHHSLGFSPNQRPARELSTMISKYHMANLSKQRFIDNTNMDGLFVEFRNVDGIRVPSATASMMMLYRAMVYKAVELSLNGIIQVESMSSNWRKNKIATNELTEGQLKKTNHAFLIKESKRLISLCENYLKKEDKTALDILNKLAEKPVSIRCKEGTSLKQIDRDLYQKQKELNKQEQKLLYLVIKGETEAETIGQWKKAVSQELGCSVRYIEKMFLNIREITQLNIMFDNEQKNMRID